MPDIVEKSGAFQELSVEKTPVNGNDVVNKTYADSLTGSDLGNITEDVLAAVDNTYDLGSTAKRWKNVYAMIAVLSSMIILGGLALYTSNNELFINGSLTVNGSITAVDNITADFYYGDGSKLTGVGAASDSNCNATGSCSDGNVAYLNYANDGDFNITGNASIGRYKANGLGFTLNAINDDLHIDSDVEGSNYFGIHTTGAFMDLYANPGPSNDYLMLAISETQGADTEMNFYEGGTGHNRFWSSGSVRIGSGKSNLCSNITSTVDCDTSATGADLVVEDDTWTGGKMYNHDMNTSNISFGTTAYIRANSTTLIIKVN